MEDMFKEAKLKALSLLNYMDRTESQLRQKLKEKSFSEEAIDQAIEYVKSFGYINDAGYAERYILNRKGSKSRQEIYAGLLQKGICKENVEKAMEDCYEPEDELVAIRRLCEKKNFVSEQATNTQKNKMYNYLLRKGFRREDILDIIMKTV